MKRTLDIQVESWPLRQTFTISRGSKTAAQVLLVEITEGEHRGRAECVPYERYGESIGSVVSQIESLRPRLCEGLDRQELQRVLKPGAARNALDCALWDVEAKRRGRPVWELAGLGPPQVVTTAYTLSLDTVEAMAAAARDHAERPLLKLKLGAEKVPERVAAVRREARQSRLIVDANEAWTVEQLVEWMSALKSAGVELLEQPLPEGKDEALRGVKRLVPIGADESCHASHDLEDVREYYDVINIKLDKTGGLTEALELRRRAMELGLDFMVGCMVGTSLAMAPAVLLAAGARFVDLDGPLLLAEDRPHGLEFEGSKLKPPSRELWG